jgi:hypothetical protein
MILKCYNCGVYRLICFTQNNMCFECKRLDEKNNFELKCKMKNDDIQNLEKFLIKNPDKIYQIDMINFVNKQIFGNYSLILTDL